MTARTTAGVLVREIEHGPEAQQHAVAFEGVELAIQFGFGQLEDLRHLRGVQAAAFEQKFQERSHIRRSFAKCERKSILNSILIEIFV